MVARDGGALARARDGERVRTLAVTVTGTSPVTGRLVVTDASGTDAVRDIEGEHCEAVARALAVLVALSVEPPLPADVDPVPPMVSAPVAEQPAPAPDVRPRRWRLGVSVGGTLSAEAAPGLVPGVAGYLELYREGPSPFSPSFRIGAETGATSTIARSIVDFGAPRITTEKTVGRVDACPFRWVAAQPWSQDELTVQTCARVDVGRLDAYSIDYYTDAARPWAAVGALLRVRWVFPRLFIEYEAGAMFPLTRERFQISSTDLFVVPAVAATMSVGVGVFIL
jgi:hypothetical protein